MGIDYDVKDMSLADKGLAEGHPSEVMDMSFANQALCSEFMWKTGRQMKKLVYSVPDEIDKNVALLKLQCLDVKIDKLTAEQRKYLASWEMGT